MEAQFHKTLVNYFSYAETLNNTWHQIIKTLVRPIESLKNQCEQLRHVMSNAVDNVEICQIMHTREKLIFKINIGIDDEIALIKCALYKLNNLYQELKNKLIHLQTLKNKMSEADSTVNNLIKGTSHRPQLCLLLKSALQVHEYYSQFYDTLNFNYKLLNRNNEETIEKLVSSLKTNDILYTKVIKILAITQFLIKETTV